MAIITKKNGKTMLADKVYSVGKKVVQLVLPAGATLYFALSQIWHLPDGTKVIGSIAALATFLGVTLHISSAQYDASGAAYDGTVHAVNNAEGTRVGFNVDPQDFITKNSVHLKVIPPPVDMVTPEPSGVETPPSISQQNPPQATAETPLPPSRSSTMGEPPPSESSS